MRDWMRRMWGTTGCLWVIIIALVLIFNIGCCPSCALGVFLAHDPPPVVMCFNDPVYVERIGELIRGE